MKYLSLGFDLGHLTGHDGDDGLVAVGGDVVDVVHLAAVDQGEAVEDVEVLLAEEQQALRGVQALDAATGKALWEESAKRSHEENATPPNGPATPTSCSDGEFR